MCPVTGVRDIPLLRAKGYRVIQYRKDSFFQAVGLAQKRYSVNNDRKQLVAVFDQGA